MKATILPYKLLSCITKGYVMGNKKKSEGLDPNNGGAPLLDDQSLFSGRIFLMLFYINQFCKFGVESRQSDFCY